MSFKSYLREDTYTTSLIWTGRLFRSWGTPTRKDQSPTFLWDQNSASLVLSVADRSLVHFHWYLDHFCAWWNNVKRTEQYMTNNCKYWRKEYQYNYYLETKKGRKEGSKERRNDVCETKFHHEQYLPIPSLIVCLYFSGITWCWVCYSCIACYMQKIEARQSCSCVCTSVSMIYGIQCIIKQQH